MLALLKISIQNLPKMLDDLIQPTPSLARPASFWLDLWLHDCDDPMKGLTTLDLQMVFCLEKLFVVVYLQEISQITSE